MARTGNQPLPIWHARFSASLLPPYVQQNYAGPKSTACSPGGLHCAFFALRAASTVRFNQVSLRKPGSANGGHLQASLDGIDWEERDINGSACARTRQQCNDEFGLLRLDDSVGHIGFGSSRGAQTMGDRICVCLSQMWTDQHLEQALCKI